MNKFHIIITATFRLQHNFLADTRIRDDCKIVGRRIDLGDAR